MKLAGKGRRSLSTDVLYLLSFLKIKEIHLFCVLIGCQFYRCFLILFHCKHPLTEDVQSSMPSKTTMVQMNRRVLDSSPAGPPVGEPITQDAEGLGTEESDRTEPAVLPAPPETPSSC